MLGASSGPRIEHCYVRGRREAFPRKSPYYYSIQYFTEQMHTYAWIAIRLVSSRKRNLATLLQQIIIEPNQQTSTHEIQS